MRDGEECTKKWQSQGKEGKEKEKEGKKEAKGGKEFKNRVESHLKKVSFINKNYQKSLCL